MFICEADESDGTFLKLNPCVTVITNIDKDHMDHYKSLDEIINCFEKFINKVPFYGCICANMDDPILLRLLPNINQKIITYGLNPLADVTATQIELQGLKTSFVPIVNNKKLDKVTLCMPGKYNIQNALAAFAVAASLQLPLDNISTSLSRFQGVTHRFSIIGQSKSVCVVDDYAHNPHKIRTVVSHLKESMPNAHICAIVQPHRYSRVNSLLKEFGTSLKHADSAIILPVYSAGEKPIQDINHYRLANEIKLNSFYNQPSKCLTAENFEQAIDISKEIFSLEASSKEKIFLCLGAGDIKNLGPLLYKNLVEHV